jgi:molecular chaperone IbpA
MENLIMRNALDFSPYRRSLIGFEPLFDFVENAARLDAADGYPPYDIEQLSDDDYRIRLAVAGYTDADIELTVHNGVLVVTGRKEERTEQTKYLYRGIAAGGFERRFQLADYVNVAGANLADGILEVELKREVPEAAKPKKITIGQAPAPKRITRARQPEAA